MPFVVQHGSTLPVSLANFFIGRDQAERAAQREETRQQEAFGESLGRGITIAGQQIGQGMTRRAIIEAEAQRQQAAQQAAAQRQADAQHRQAALDQILNDTAVQSLPPAVRSRWMNNHQRVDMAEADVAANRMPDEEGMQVISGLVAENDAILKKYKPGPPPTWDEKFDGGVVAASYPDKGYDIVTDEKGKPTRFKIEPNPNKMTPDQKDASISTWNDTKYEDVQKDLRARYGREPTEGEISEVSTRRWYKQQELNARIEAEAAAGVAAPVLPPLPPPEQEIGLGQRLMQGAIGVGFQGARLMPKSLGGAGTPPPSQEALAPVLQEPIDPVVDAVTAPLQKLIDKHTKKGEMPKVEEWPESARRAAKLYVDESLAAILKAYPTLDVPARLLPRLHVLQALSEK